MEGWNVLASCYPIIVLYIVFRLLDYLVFLVSTDNDGRRAVQVPHEEFPNDVPDIHMRNRVLLGYHDGITNVQDSEYFNCSQFLRQSAGSRDLCSLPNPLFPEGTDDQRLLRRNDYSSNLTSRNNNAGEASSLERFDQARIVTGTRTNSTGKRPSKGYSRRPKKFLVACWNCDFSQMKSLIEKGVDPCIKTKAGETGLILCVYRMAKGKRQWNPDCLELLIDSGCPIDGTTNEHSTALHFAVRTQHIESIKWLLSKGASVGIQNNAGYLPFDIAMASGREDIAKLLSFHHLDPGSEASNDDSQYYSAKD